MEWGLLGFHHVLFLLFLVLVQSQKSQHLVDDFINQALTFMLTFDLDLNREGPFTFVCKSSCQDWQDWYI